MNTPTPSPTSMDDPRRLREILDRSLELASRHGLSSVLVGVAGFEGERGVEAVRDVRVTVQVDAHGSEDFTGVEIRALPTGVERDLTFPAEPSESLGAAVRRGRARP